MEKTWKQLAAVESHPDIDTLETLEQLATSHDMSVETLLKLYIGQGLWQDVAQRFADQVLDLTAHVLARHGQSQAQVEAIVREIMLYYLTNNIIVTIWGGMRCSK